MSASERARRSTEGGRSCDSTALRLDDLNFAWMMSPKRPPYPYAGAVFGVLLLLLLCVPLLELYVIILAADQMGTASTILLLVLVSLVGAWMVRRSGLGVLNQIRKRLNDGQLPATELVDGMLILVAGALMLTPGFITDAVGLSLLFLPGRVLVRTLLMRRFAKRVTFGSAGPISWRAGMSGSNLRDSDLHQRDVRDVYETREVPDSGTHDTSDSRPE